MRIGVCLGRRPGESIVVDAVDAPMGPEVAKEVEVIREAEREDEADIDEGEGARGVDVTDVTDDEKSLRLSSSLPLLNLEGLPVMGLTDRPEGAEELLMWRRSVSGDSLKKDSN
jgi:hypothetical protein